MYSRPVQIGDEKNPQVIVGYSVKAPSKAVEIPDSLIADVDAALRREADKIARSLSASRLPLRSRGGGFFADGFQVVDSNTQQVVEQGPWLPAFLPKGVRLPAPGLQFYVAAGKLYLAQTNTNGRLSATSFCMVASFGWIAFWFAVGFLLAGTTTNALSRRFLRNYFAVTGIQILHSRFDSL